MITSAHKDKGVAKTEALASIYLMHEMTRVAPALAGAICDLPLIRIWGSKPEMREDMVKIGTGVSKVANLAYRAQFSTWAMKLRGQVNGNAITPAALVFLIQNAGKAAGLGEWRNERKGVFGGFHMGDIAEAAEWDAFAAGKGPLPAGPELQVEIAA
jgi:hypothetical protein